MTERPISAEHKPERWSASRFTETTHGGQRLDVTDDVIALAAEVERLRAAIEAHRTRWIKANGDRNLAGNARPVDLELWRVLGHD